MHVHGLLRLERKEGRQMSRIFWAPEEVEAWFAANHPLNKDRLRQRLAAAGSHPGPEWTRLTSKFSVRLHQGVWEVTGIAVR